ncbi:enoyl-CoA hydratase (plasmid) [Skermanella mucosa]|uniref:oxepin-CoA hydrolase, alternative type n=1 Tax=Skermanella mucosa TaxID=1789672 RepID=UPI00192C15D8|nr:enoyl-CoA hydratase [Skermanella mucosa]UEM25214.1 enoyl-CoA hydratase [Skermanella mucosa]
MTEMLEEWRGRVLVLTISDPATRNALGPAVYAKGAEALRRAAWDPGIGAVVLTGADGAFCSGGNLNRLAGLRGEQPEHGAEQAEAGIGLLHDWIRLLRACPKPVIAAVEGVAAGAGFSVALACDMIVAAKDARFVLAYVKVGLSPDGGATAFLARALPRQMLAEIALEGGAIEAGRLHHAGLVNALCDPGAALESAVARAQKLADGPTGAITSIKRLIDAAQDGDLDSQLDRERRAFVGNLFHADAGEGIAAFLEKRPARFHP